MNNNNNTPSKNTDDHTHDAQEEVASNANSAISQSSVEAQKEILEILQKSVAALSILHGSFQLPKDVVTIKEHLNTIRDLIAQERHPEKLLRDRGYFFLTRTEICKYLNHSTQNKKCIESKIWNVKKLISRGKALLESNRLFDFDNTISSIIDELNQTSVLIKKYRDFFVPIQLKIKNSNLKDLSNYNKFTHQKISFSNAEEAFTAFSNRIVHNLKKGREYILFINFLITQLQKINSLNLEGPPSLSPSRLEEISTAINSKLTDFSHKVNLQELSVFPQMNSGQTDHKRNLNHNNQSAAYFKPTKRNDHFETKNNNNNNNNNTNSNRFAWVEKKQLFENQTVEKEAPLMTQNPVDYSLFDGFTPFDQVRDEMIRFNK